MKNLNYSIFFRLVAGVGRHCPRLRLLDLSGTEEVAQRFHLSQIKNQTYLTKIQDDKTQTITMATRWRRREAQSCSGRRWVVNSGQLSWYQLFSENISNSLIFYSDSLCNANIVSPILKQISPPGRSQWNSTACLCCCHSAYKGCKLSVSQKHLFWKFMLRKVDSWSWGQ